jgi:hypothetical protein
VEQTFVSQKSPLEINDAIIEVIKNKEKKGKVYARSRNLITLVNKVGKIDPSKLLSFRSVLDNFASYWIIFKEANNKTPTYIAILLKSRVEEDMLMFRVNIYPVSGKFGARYLGNLDS